MATPKNHGKPANHGERWTPSDVRTLENLAVRDVPTPDIARTLHRTEDAVTSKASEELISLKPTYQNPYGTKKR